jgi:hypothetical protein
MNPRRRLGATAAGVACAGCCAAAPLLATAGVGTVLGCAAVLATASATALGAVTTTAAGGLIFPTGRASRSTGSSAERAPRGPLLAAIAALLVLTAGLFAIGVSIERSRDHESRAERQIVQPDGIRRQRARTPPSSLRRTSGSWVWIRRAPRWLSS